MNPSEHLNIGNLIYCALDALDLVNPRETALVIQAAYHAHQTSIQLNHTPDQQSDCVVLTLLIGLLT